MSNESKDLPLRRSSAAWDVALRAVEKLHADQLITIKEIISYWDAGTFTGAEATDKIVWEVTPYLEAYRPKVDQATRRVGPDGDATFYRIAEVRKEVTSIEAQVMLDRIEEAYREQKEECDRLRTTALRSAK